MKKKNRMNYTSKIVNRNKINQTYKNCKKKQ